MNREHDLTHSLLARALGLPHSPTLHDVAHGRAASDLHAIEEEAVLALQRFARAAGVDLVATAAGTDLAAAAAQSSPRER